MWAQDNNGSQILQSAQRIGFMVHIVMRILESGNKVNIRYFSFNVCYVKNTVG